MNILQSKTAVITGAGSGIGRALAQGLAAFGVNLALMDIDPDGLGETIGRLPEGDVKTKVYPVDVSDRLEMEAAAARIIDEMGPVDILINNAGVSSSGAVSELGYELLEWTMNINFWGVVHGTKAFLPYLLERPEASLVNISSVFGLIGMPRRAAYCASKFAVRGFTEALRLELHDTPVAVTVILPGGVRTNIVHRIRAAGRDDPLSDPAARRVVTESFRTSPEEAAQAIIDGIRKKRPRVLIGPDARTIDRLARWMPAGYDRVILRRIRKMRAGLK